MPKDSLKVENWTKFDSVVFVLGAGASKDSGFPLWSELRDYIQSILSDSTKLACVAGRFNEQDLQNLSIWKKIFEQTDWNTLTIDSVIYKNGQTKDSILRLISQKLSECERRDMEENDE